MTSPDIKAQCQVPSRRTRTALAVAALWAAGLVATALGGNISVAVAVGGDMSGARPAAGAGQLSPGLPTGDLGPGQPASTANGADSDHPAPAQQPLDPAPQPAAGPAPSTPPPASPPPTQSSPAAAASAQSDSSGDRTPGGAAKPPASDDPAVKSCQAVASKQDGHGAHLPPSGRREQTKRSGLGSSARREQADKHRCRHRRHKRHAHKRRKHRRTSGHGVGHSVQSSSDPSGSGSTIPLGALGPLPIGVPNFFIDSFRIPPFLLPIYQAAGIQYGIRWEVLAAINQIETDYGRNLSVSTAGALGWMQFMPDSWTRYGVDANRDGRKDPFNPVDAIFAAARYLKAAGADEDLRKGIFSYNHAGWYVDSVLARARMIGALPDDLIGSLSGLTQGRLPVPAPARYAGAISRRDAGRRVTASSNAAIPIESDGERRSIDIYAKARSPAIAVQDGEIVATGRTRRLGSYVRLRDAYGNAYTYGHLASIATRVPVPRRRTQTMASITKQLALPRRDPKPTRAASAGRQRAGKISRRAHPAASHGDRPPAAKPRGAVAAKQRLFAHPARRRARSHGGSRQLTRARSALPAHSSLGSYMTGAYGLRRKDVALEPLVPGRHVVAGTILGRIGKPAKNRSPHLSFEIRPAGRGAPRIDPKPILDGWKLLQSTAIYRAQDSHALLGQDNMTIGQIMLMSKEALARRVLVDPRIEIYSCGRRDIEGGIIDRRVLATLELLVGSGLKPAVSSLSCGHGYRTAGGNVSEHSSGNAVDIAKINGIPILGHQGKGSITDTTIRRLLTLQGSVMPHQIISLMKYSGAPNTLALSDHDDHIHVGFRPRFMPGSHGAGRLESVLKPAQWTKLIGRLGRIDNPIVRVRPSSYAIRVKTERRPRSRGGD